MMTAMTKLRGIFISFLVLQINVLVFIFNPDQKLSIIFCVLGAAAMALNLYQFQNFLKTFHSKKNQKIHAKESLSVCRISDYGPYIFLNTAYMTVVALSSANFLGNNIEYQGVHFLILGLAVGHVNLKMYGAARSLNTQNLLVLK